MRAARRGAGLAELTKGVEGLGIGVLGGYFKQYGDAAAETAVGRVAEALSVTRQIVWPEAERARASAYLITAAEGGAPHVHVCKPRPRILIPPCVIGCWRAI